MTTLKTLKDVEGLKNAPDTPIDGSYNDGYGTGWCVGINELKKELRAEAIKWAKDLNDGTFMSNEAFRIIETTETFGIVNWIKHFFNITEKDLEESKC